MNSPVFRFAAPYLTALMLLFSAFVTLRGHNDPGGGFIGGLVAASGLVVHGMAFGPDSVRRALHFHPSAVAASGLLVAALAGVVSGPAGMPYLTGLWWFPAALDGVGLSTPMLFDIGVYLVVTGSLASIVLALEGTDR